MPMYDIAIKCVATVEATSPEDARQIGDEIAKALAASAVDLPDGGHLIHTTGVDAVDDAKE